MVPFDLSLNTWLAPTLILVAGCIDDLRTRKFHNQLFLICIAFALVWKIYFFGRMGALDGSLGLLAALAFYLPLTLLRATGAGDLKLMLAFGLASHFNAVFSVFIYSLIWAVVFGVIKLITARKLGLLVNFRQNRDALNADFLKIPFTIPLLIGWLHYGLMGSPV